MRAKSDGAALASSSSSAQTLHTSPSPPGSMIGDRNNRIRKNTSFATGKGFGSTQQRPLSFYVSRFFLICLVLIFPTVQYVSISSKGTENDSNSKGLRGNDSTKSREEISSSVKGTPTAPKIPTIPSRPIVTSPLPLNQNRNDHQQQPQQASPPPSAEKHTEAEWSAIVDKVTGKNYWWNKATGETTKVILPVHIRPHTNRVTNFIPPRHY